MPDSNPALLIRDPSGLLVPVSRTIQSKRWEGWDSAMPSGFEVLSGTLTIATWGDTMPGPGQVEIATAGSVGATAQVRSSFGIDPSRFHQIEVYAEGLDTDADSNVDMWLKVCRQGVAPTRGVTLYHVAGQSWAELRVHTTSGDAVFATRVPLVGASIGQKRKNVGLHLRPVAKVVWVTMDDQIIFQKDISGTAFATSGSSYRPEIGISTTNGAARKLRFGAMGYRVGYL